MYRIVRFFMPDSEFESLEIVYYDTLAKNMLFYGSVEKLNLNTLKFYFLSEYGIYFLKKGNIKQNFKRSCTF